MRPVDEGPWLVLHVNWNESHDSPVERVGLASTRSQILATCHAHEQQQAQVEEEEYEPRTLRSSDTTDKGRNKARDVSILITDDEGAIVYVAIWAGP